MTRYSGIIILSCLLISLSSISVRTGETRPWTHQALDRLKHGQTGLPRLTPDPDNPPTAAKLALGRKLFFDRRLSLNGTLSCAMCHIPEQGFTSNEVMTPVGLLGRSLRRNAPSLLNVAYARHLFHDGRETRLETQFILPLTNPKEMAAPSVGHVLDLLTRLTDYDGLFEQAFNGNPPTVQGMGQALALYQQSLIAGDSPFDRYYYSSETNALSASAQRGLTLFSGRGNCATCHQITETFALFQDHRFHDTGHGWHREYLRQHPSESLTIQTAPGVFIEVDRRLIEAVSDPVPADLGRYEVTRKIENLWQVKTPNLRNLTLTAPYMHDGRLSTLSEVIDFYDRGGFPHKGQSPLIRPLGLSARQKSDLLSFLQSLTSPHVAELIREARSSAPDS
ncbi:MAG: methylamine utilization protein MauG [Rhodobacteraceae bacterium]|nr:methylamine utilization protein MauG [Paracoccaceae bacterium]